MNSSYQVYNLNYKDIFETIIYLNNPKSILEIGILNGFSLEIFAKNTHPNTKIEAYDIFDEFNGNCSSKAYLLNKFEKYDNIKINYGDFYKLHKNLDNFDLIHIDIANDGDILEFAIKNYLPKLNNNGIMIFEGGSPERDNIGWMDKYNKPKINPVILKHNTASEKSETAIASGNGDPEVGRDRRPLAVKVIGTFPSISILKKQL